MVFEHPNPGYNRLVQRLTLALGILMIVSAILMIVLGAALAAQGFCLLIFGGIFLLALSPLVWMQTAAAPSLRLDDDGLTLTPVIWRPRRVAWDEIESIKPYVLLPPSDSEFGRKAMVGRKKYRAAAGYMLIIPSLPPIYRLHGLFTGEGWKGVIAITNRAHADYEPLIRTLRHHAGERFRESSA